MGNMPFIKGRKESNLCKSPLTLTPNLERKKIATTHNPIPMIKNGKDFSNDLARLHDAASITLSSLLFERKNVNVKYKTNTPRTIKNNFSMGFCTYLVVTSQ